MNAVTPQAPTTDKLPQATIMSVLARHPQSDGTYKTVQWTLGSAMPGDEAIEAVAALPAIPPQPAFPNGQAAREASPGHQATTWIRRMFDKGDEGVDVFVLPTPNSPLHKEGGGLIYTIPRTSIDLVQKVATMADWQVLFEEAVYEEEYGEPDDEPEEPEEEEPIAAAPAAIVHPMYIPPQSPPPADLLPASMPYNGGQSTS